MIEIPTRVQKEVKLIVDYLEKYQNKDNLSWTEVYKKAVKLLNIKIDDNNLLLSSTVKELTNRGYDILPEPFKLERFR